MTRFRTFAWMIVAAVWGSEAPSHAGNAPDAGVGAAVVEEPNAVDQVAASVTVDPNAPTSAVDFTSQPPAGLWIDGVARGRTPLLVDLPQGAHAYELRLEGYVTASGTFDLDEANLVVPPVTLVRAAADAVTQTFVGNGVKMFAINGDLRELPTSMVLLPDTYQVRVRDAAGAWHNGSITVQSKPTLIDLTALLSAPKAAPAP